MSPADRRYGVVTTLPSYVAAVAGLARSAALVSEFSDFSDISGAVAVVPGAGDWWRAMVAARAGGAAAVVIADPVALPREAIEACPWPGDIPVIIDRPRLRPDVVADAVRARRDSPPRILAVECAAPAAGLDAVIRDGLGWARSLLRGPLALRSGTAAGQARIALLDSAGPGGGSIPATLAGTVVGGLYPGGLLQVLALGEVRTEVTVDHPAGLTCLETSAEDGTLRAPERYESSARLALRRALAACSSGQAVTDLEDLLEDMALVWDLPGS